MALAAAACGGGGGTYGSGEPGEGGSRLGLAGRTGGEAGGVGDGGAGVGGGAVGGPGTGGGFVLTPRNRGGAPGAGGVGGSGVGGGRGGVGGAAASVGRGGASGRGGSGGRAGSGPPPTCGDPYPPTSCPASLCGNGVRDSCLVSWGYYYPFCAQEFLVEPCEGKDLGLETCESLPGFASGTLRCTSSCTLDTRGCSECTTASSIIRCGAAPLPFTPELVALAASETEIGVVTAALTGELPELSFTRLSPTLDGLSATTIVEPGLKVPNNYGYVSPPGYLIAAPLPSGWVVGIFAGAKLYLHVLDAAGEDVRRVELDTVGYGLFVPRPDGGPLLVWAVTRDDYIVDYLTSVIAADGSAMSAPKPIPLGSGWLSEMGRGLYLDGAFYVPYTVSDAYTDSQLRIVPVATDGALGTALAPLPGERVRQPTLTRRADGLALTYFGIVPYYYYYDSRLYWQALTVTGDRTSYAVRIDLYGPQPSPPLSVAGDTVFPLLGRAGDSLEVLRVGASGEIASHSEIVRPASLGFDWFDAVVRGPDVVLGWFVAGSRELRLARVTP